MPEHSGAALGIVASLERRLPLANISGKLATRLERDSAVAVGKRERELLHRMTCPGRIA
jgi:hypothetical protein